MDAALPRNLVVPVGHARQSVSRREERGGRRRLPQADLVIEHVKTEITPLLQRPVARAQSLRHE
jgi:hypothetical protein